MKKTVLINVVGLTSRLIGTNTPFLERWLNKVKLKTIEPVLPAVTCSAQATYLTGKWPAEHGIVGNGWYFEEECEVKFWRQSNKLVQAPKIWELLKEEDPSFTCANLFWWYNMYSSVDFSITPRPNYLADGRKIPDIYTHPADLRDSLQGKLGQFPLFNFWGPKTSIKSSSWIADAAKEVDTKYQPTLTLIYLPHLDYNLQRHGIDFEKISDDLREIDLVLEDLITFYEKRETEVMLISEYGITDVNQAISLNRVLRKAGLITIREERGRELLDAGASRAFAVADHQVAHIYVKNREDIQGVKNILSSVQGIQMVLDGEDKAQYQLNHPRSGDLIAVADKNTWFSYYYWLEDAKAPDFARTVDIHRKPGYDPVEMVLNPEIKFPLLTVGYKLLKKKLGFRTLMDVIPLNDRLIKGSHGRIPESQEDWPILAGSVLNASEQLHENTALKADQIFQLLLKYIKAK
ncbi:alkaline phosphatase family protein [Fulvivirgaceae bacterium BMA12]|uniref:Alkaline phosphatase family protein n=1 Tax=Agaribacillus aureus TaxID=3051825 RepID=A0ABT8LB66_9BACT|nr:alkaline phosphatase family protein [Fulvivirgaceae bacterium BMA12]